jgi:hypothetical protein
VHRCAWEQERDVREQPYDEHAAPSLLDNTIGGIGRDRSRVDLMCSVGWNVSEATFYSEMSRENARMHAGMEMHQVAISTAILRA